VSSQHVSGGPSYPTAIELARLRAWCARYNVEIEQINPGSKNVRIAAETETKKESAQHGE
jgi:hypothetical protein